ncbi:MAG: PVC-type heme-binding CxxCH protein [Limisphaerales bacterium]
MFRCLLSLLCCGLVVSSVSAAEPEVTSEEMPRFPAYEPADALKTFKVKEGYHLELAAHEPLVIDPITMCFDEQGRLFVVEMVDYSERREENPHLGRIRMLTDTDGDGKFDKASVYADNLPWPTAVICYNGGIFVGATPNIWWCRDNDNDGQADERKIAVTGFAGGQTRLNVQGLFNSFQWGLDNRIHGAFSSMGGKNVRRPGAPEDEGINGRYTDFSFDPRTMEIRLENGGGQYGMSFDSQGRKFMCSNSRHAMHSVYDRRYAGGNRHFAMPSGRLGIAKEGNAAEVFRLSADEPWRVIRTRWRISGVVRGAVEGGGRVSGYFTGATGVTVQKGAAYGSGFMDNLFVGDAGGNLVHRKIVEENGVDLIARRPDDEQNYEFIASTDNWFRPVHFQNGPDGCLYIADMYRETIEHPWSIPEEIKKHLDLNSGNDRGRVYRIAPDGYKYAGKVNLAAKSDRELVALLDHPNGWQRETASRLLFTRKAKTGVIIRALNAKTALGRIHALHLAAALEYLKPAHVKSALKDKDARVREHAVALAEQLGLAAELPALVSDDAVRVRFQLALSLGQLDAPNEAEVLAELLRRDYSDRWVRAACLNSLTKEVAAVFVELAADKGFRSQSADRALLSEIARIIGARGMKGEIQQVLAVADNEWLSADMMSYLPALNEGLRARRKTVLDFTKGTSFQSRFDQLPGLVGKGEADAGSLIRVASIGGYKFIGKELLDVLRRGSAPNKRAALDALLAMPDSAVFGAVIEAWKHLDVSLRKAAVAGFLRNRTRTKALLGEVQSGMIRPSMLDARQVQSLRGNRDSATRALAIKVFGAEKKADYGALMSQFKPSLTAKGNAAKGREIYQQRCATCHRANGEGYQLGPDMVTVKTKGRESLLMNIVNPNAELAAQFMAFEIETRDDESYTALIGNETTTHLTIKMASGVQQTFVRSDILGMKSSGKSLMPEELHKDLTVQQMADLLTFIEQSN